MRSAEALTDHLERPLARGHVPVDACTGAAGGAACGDLVRISVALDPDSPDGLIADAGFDASGCGAVVAAGSATVGLVRGMPLLSAAAIGAGRIADELGGLSVAKQHAAELAADALHRALGQAARDRAALEPVAGRTLVAMSGGVDSAVAALLVARGRGAETVGVTLELWSDPQNDGDLSCCSAQAVRGARELAHELGMAHLSIDLRAEFRAGVVDHWLADQASGLTSNPCVRCNGNVRLDAMLELAGRLGSETLATGHYARVTRGFESSGSESNRQVEDDFDGTRTGAVDGFEGAVDGSEQLLLRMAVDEGKDQSYVLAALAPESLARLCFPLGEMEKPQVREIARRAGLAVARRRDSQDLCFLAGTRQGAFLERHSGLGARPGAIVDGEGRVLGEHRGAHVFTVGQRHGLGIGGGQPLYVLGTDARENTVTVGSREELLTRGVPVRDVTLHRDGQCVDGVRMRSHGRRFACRLGGGLGAGGHERVNIELEEPAERTAPGQLACLYAGDLVVGHGTITT
ncbi:MAG TPA: iron-sulfur cluster assembly scaffold protein [Solirubrobacteraceae bacterium]|jgi:tRNA-specific 2-thiouridylase